MNNSLNQAFITYFNKRASSVADSDAVCLQLRDLETDSVITFAWFDAAEVASVGSASEFVTEIVDDFEAEHGVKAYSEDAAVTVDVADIEGSIKHYYCSLTDSVDWDGYQQYLEVVERVGDSELVAAGLNLEIDLEDIEERYAGRAESDEDFAQEYLEDTCALGDVPDFIRNYIDWEKLARDMMLTDFICDNGYYFYNN